MIDPAILVAIVNYRTPSLAIDAVRSIISALDGKNRRAIVVDNGSADGSADLLADAIEKEGWHDRVTLLPLDDNRGFGAGNNAAVTFARSRGFEPELIWFLNPDAVAAPGALDRFVEFFADHHQAGIAGTAIDNPDGSTFRSAFRFPTPLGEMESVLGIALATRLLHHRVIAPPPSDIAIETEWVSGASMVVRGDLHAWLDGFDERYFLYFEETDFCRRAGLLGAECWYVPTARVTHFAGASTGVTGDRRGRHRRPRFWFESRARYFRHHLGNGALIAANIGWLAAYPIGRIMARIRGRNSPEAPMLWRDMLRFGYRDGT